MDDLLKNAHWWSDEHRTVKIAAIEYVRSSVTGAVMLSVRFDGQYGSTFIIVTDKDEAKRAMDAYRFGAKVTVVTSLMGDETLIMNSRIDWYGYLTGKAKCNHCGNYSVDPHTSLCTECADADPDADALPVLDIDDTWSIMYDPENNDRPLRWMRHGVEHGPFSEDNAIVAMFYALLEKN